MLILSGSVGDNELLWIETLWQGVLYSIFQLHRRLLFHNLKQPIWKVLKRILDEASCLLLSDADIMELPLSMCTETICQKVISLSIYLQFYLDLFLFRASGHSRNVEPVKEWLLKILGQIIPLINHLPNISDYIHDAYSIRSEVLHSNNKSAPENLIHLRPRGLKSGDEPRYRDSALVLLYAFAWLLKTLLEQTHESTEIVTSKIDESAIALCRVCGNFPTDTFNHVMAPLLIKRSLFWAGIVLKKSHFSAGSCS